MSHHVYNIVRWRAFPVPSLFALPIGAQKILQLKDDWREFGKAEKGHEDTNVGASKDDGAKTISAWLWWSAPMGIKSISKYRCGRRINNYTGRLGRQERKYISWPISAVLHSSFRPYWLTSTKCAKIARGLRARWWRRTSKRAKPPT